MKYSPEQIGELVKNTRKGMGVTQKDLALTSGTGLRFIIDLEKNSLWQKRSTSICITASSAG